MKDKEIAIILDGIFSEFDHWDCIEECAHKVALVEWRDAIADQIANLFEHYKSPEEVRRGKEMVREAFRFPK